MKKVQFSDYPRLLYLTLQCMDACEKWNPGFKKRPQPRYPNSASRSTRTNHIFPISCHSKIKNIKNRDMIENERNLGSATKVKLPLRIACP